MSTRTEPYTAVLEAALNGGEDEIRDALEALDTSQLSRLRNTLRLVADLSEAQRKQLWRQR